MLNYFVSILISIYVYTFGSFAMIHSSDGSEIFPAVNVWNNEYNCIYVHG